MSDDGSEIDSKYIQVLSLLFDLNLKSQQYFWFFTSVSLTDIIICLPDIGKLYNALSLKEIQRKCFDERPPILQA